VSDCGCRAHWILLGAMQPGTSLAATSTMPQNRYLNPPGATGQAEMGRLSAYFRFVGTPPRATICQAAGHYTMSFRKIDLQPGAPYYNQWMAYSRVRLRSLALFPLFFFGGALLTSLLGGTLESLWSTPPKWVMVAGFVPMVMGVIAAIAVSQGPIRWLCPRCGKRFHSTFWRHNWPARRCLHCKLPMWAPGPDAAS
jgi:hypothetical protein